MYTHTHTNTYIYVYVQIHIHVYGYKGRIITRVLTIRKPVRENVTDRTPCDRGAVILLISFTILAVMYTYIYIYMMYVYTNIYI
jgi:hypothetical protein